MGEYSIHEIMNGTAQSPGGLIGFVRQYIHSEMGERSDVLDQVLDKYLTFLSKRASGEYLTTAAWIRRYVEEHPEYQKDSVVTHAINFDLVRACSEISEGSLEAANLLPPISVRQVPKGTSPV